LGTHAIGLARARGKEKGGGGREKKKENVKAAWMAEGAVDEWQPVRRQPS